MAHKNIQKFQKLAIVLATVAVTIFPLVTFAVVYCPPGAAPTPGTPFCIENIGGTIGLGAADLRTTVVKAISWFLGILALIAVSFIIYGGFLWTTAAGSEERIEKAKKTIGAAVIGLIIVLLAWAIVTFVAGTTRNVTE